MNLNLFNGLPGPFDYPCPEILFEDNHLIIVNKRASDIVQTDKTMDTPMTDAIKAYLRDKYNKPGNVFLGVVHRLDRPVSGAVIFARTSKALERMNLMFRNREITKKYWAIVKDPPEEPSGHLKNFIRKNPLQNKSYIFTSEVKGSLLAELKYRVMGMSERYTLLEVELMTGRHHQIRAQLSHIGCPIRGDLKYGYSRPNQDVSISLHSRSIEFTHPVSGEGLKIKAKPPQDPVWDFFLQIFGDE